MKLSTFKDLGIVAALAGAAYFVYTKLNAVPDALAKTGSAIGIGFADFQDAIRTYFGNSPVGETLFYTVHFSNGNHAIPASTVDRKSGRFTYRGEAFVMKFKPTPGKPAGTGEWWAFKP